MRSSYLIALAAALVLFALARRFPAGAADVAGGVVEAIRGLRNNNPGNIRYYPSIQWQGQVGDDGEGYAVFDTRINGLRAMARDLATKYRNGFNTANKIIGRYAPPGKDHNPTTYAPFVASWLKVGVDEPINVLQRMPDLMRAMVRFELGAVANAVVSDSDIREGIRAANV